MPPEHFQKNRMPPRLNQILIPLLWLAGSSAYGIFAEGVFPDDPADMEKSGHPTWMPQERWDQSERNFVSTSTPAAAGVLPVHTAPRGLRAVMLAPGATRYRLRGIGTPALDFRYEGSNRADVGRFLPGSPLAVDPVWVDHLAILPDFHPQHPGGAVYVDSGNLMLSPPEEPRRLRMGTFFNTVADETGGHFELTAHEGPIAFRAKGLRRSAGDTSFSGKAPAPTSTEVEAGAFGLSIYPAPQTTFSLAFDGTNRWFGALASLEDPIRREPLRLTQRNIQGAFTNRPDGGVFEATLLILNLSEERLETMQNPSQDRPLGRDRLLQIGWQGTHEGPWDSEGRIGIEWTANQTDQGGEPSGFPDSDSRRLAIHSEHFLETNLLTLLAGGRVEGKTMESSGRSRDYQAVALGARLGGIKEVSPSDRLRLLLRYSERHPSAGERFGLGQGPAGTPAVPGNPRLGRERYWSPEISWLRKKGPIRGSVTGFFRYYPGEFLTTFGDQPKTISTSSRHLGVEADIRGALLDQPDGKVHWVLGFDWVTASGREVADGDADMPPPRTFGQLEWSGGDWSFETGATRTLSHGNFDRGPARSQPYTLVHASLSRHLLFRREEIQIYLRLENLLDEDGWLEPSMEAPYPLIPRRNLTVGLRAEF